MMVVTHACMVSMMYEAVVSMNIVHAVVAMHAVLAHGRVMSKVVSCSGKMCMLLGNLPHAHAVTSLDVLLMKRFA